MLSNHIQVHYLPCKSHRVIEWTVINQESRINQVQQAGNLGPDLRTQTLCPGHVTSCWYLNQSWALIPSFLSWPPSSMFPLWIFKSWMFSWYVDLFLLFLCLLIIVSCSRVLSFDCVQCSGMFLALWLAFLTNLLFLLDICFNHS